MSLSCHLLPLQKTLPIQVVSISFFPPSPHPSRTWFLVFPHHRNSIIQFPSSPLFAHTRLLWYFSYFQTLSISTWTSSSFSKCWCFWDSTWRYIFFPFDTPFSYFWRLYHTILIKLEILEYPALFIWDFPSFIFMFFYTGDNIRMHGFEDW